MKVRTGSFALSEGSYFLINVPHFEARHKGCIHHRKEVQDMNLKQVKRRIKDYGFTKTIRDLGLRAINRFMILKVLKVIKIERVNPDFLQCDERYRSLFLDRAALLEFSKNAEYDLSYPFVDTASKKGDECYAILDGSTMAAYGWYSSLPTAIDLPGLQIHFDPRYIFMYKGFTHNGYRGQRLHAVGMTRALSVYLERGYKGIISDVEWNNFASLNSCYRMGYEGFGKAYVLGLGGRYFLASSPGCRQYAFGLQHETPRQSRHLAAES